MEPVNEELIERIDAYIEELFTPPDEALSQNLADADAAGLPAINVSPNQGRLLYLLAKMAGAKRVLEVGTLGGYSTTWLARALPADGVVVTLELEARHAEVARRNLERAALAAADRPARRTGRRFAPRSHPLRRPPPSTSSSSTPTRRATSSTSNSRCELSRPGTLILADNVIRHGLVLDPNPADPYDAGAKAYNEVIARHPRLESLVLPIVRARVDGMAISLVRRRDDDIAKQATAWV